MESKNDDVNGGVQNDELMTVQFIDDDNGRTVTVQVPEGTKITEAATNAGIYIPTLCHHPRLSPAGKCGLCVVSVEDGPTPVQLACSTACRRPEQDEQHDDEQQLDDAPLPTMMMKIHVHGTHLNDLSNAALKRNLEASLDHHMKRFEANHDFAPCGSLEIEDLTNWMGQETCDVSSNAITYDPSLCIGCSRCVRACDQLQGMKILEAPLVSSTQNAIGIAQAPPCMTTKAGLPLQETDCISCGQCTVFCPTGAIKEVDHTARVMRALSDPSKVCVLQTAPSVRVTISEMFGGAAGECSQGKLVAAAKACGFPFVFDTDLAADLTILEEANELLARIDIAQNGTPEQRAKSPLPMFTSCCPGWINLVEQSYPELIPHLSTCRSPMGMLSSVLRHYWWPRTHQQQQQVGGGSMLGQHEKKEQRRQHQKIFPEEEKEGEFVVDQSNLFVVAVMPCTAKKDEISRDQFRMKSVGGYHQPETDAVLTVREFARVMELCGVAQRDDPQSFVHLPELAYDNPFGESTGAAVIFGVTGGVMEAALRTAADVLSGHNLPNVKYESVRGLYGIKEATLALGANNDISLNVAVCHQMRNVREFLARLEQDDTKQYHFIEIMTCPGGCIGGGGLPQSRDADILSKRIDSVYSMDERMVKRKSHHNKAVLQLYKDLLGKPLSAISHKLLHTHYSARPRKPPILLKTAGGNSSASTVNLGDDTTNTILVIFGTQSGTAAQAAKEIKIELQQFITRPNNPKPPQVCLIAANAIAPDKLMANVQSSLASIFVTCTYGEGEFPETMKSLWDYLEGCKNDQFGASTKEGDTAEASMVRFAVFGLGSSMYAVGDQFNRSARRLDQRLEDLGGNRIIDVGLGDDQDSELYRGVLDPWMEALHPKLFGKPAAKASYIDPPEPLFRVSLAPGIHHSGFRPLPPGYHFVTLESTNSLVSEGYDRPASLFSFNLEDTGLQYNVGDHLAILPRNPSTVAKRVLELYAPEIRGHQLLSVEPVDHHGDCPFPAVLSAKEILTQYLDLCGRPSRGFLKQLFLFATTAESRLRLRSLSDQNRNADDDSCSKQDEFERFTASHTYADVLCEFASSALPPFEHLLSMIPAITPRLYSIASSPIYRADRLDLMVVLNEWRDPSEQSRVGLSTSYLFDSHTIGEKVAIQIRPGILKPPKSTQTPILMFGLGTGMAPFRAFLQHREMLQKEQGQTLGPATLYVGTRHEGHDYYLQQDYKEWMDMGILTKVHPAFSHDGVKERGGRLYFISDLLADEPQTMIEALQLCGGNICCHEEDEDDEPVAAVEVFYCGPALGIPETIQKAMTTTLSSPQGGLGLSETDAKAFMDNLVRTEDRFHAECF